jgi:CRP-like cAMP-binding protein
MLLLVEKVIILKTVSIFAAIPDSTLAEVATLLEEQVLSAGERLFEKGDPGHCMYIIVSGRLRVHDGDQLLNDLGERDIVGEMAVVESAPRSASVTAIEETRLLRLDQEPLYELMADHIEVARGIIQVLSSRLRARIEDIGDLRARLQTQEQQHDLWLLRGVGL